MGSKGVLNLTLDEIIQRQRGRNSVQYNNRRNNFGRPGGGAFQSRFYNRDLSSSLTNRLSRRPGGFSGLRRNGVVANQLRSSAGRPRKSVYSRLTINNPRRPVNIGQGSGQRNIKTKNAEDFHPVRINNGAIVKGLRSDQLLLQKLNQHRNRTLQEKLEKLRTLHEKPFTQKQDAKNWRWGKMAAKYFEQKDRVYERSERRNSSRKSSHSSRVSMDINHGLMVSFANEVVRKPKPPPVRPRRKYASPPPYSSSSSSSSSSEDSDVLPSTSRRVSTEPPKDPLTSILRLGLERPPPPKPHRQVLDPAVQKEIAALQGYAEAHSVGPGPGVKGFKMMPSRTKSSLNERFTIEKNVND